MINKELKEQLNKMSAQELVDFIREEIVEPSSVDVEALDEKLNYVLTDEEKETIASLVISVKNNVNEEKSILKSLLSGGEGLSDREKARIFNTLSTLLIHHQKEIKLMEKAKQYLTEEQCYELKKNLEEHLDARIDVFHHYITNRLEK